MTMRWQERRVEDDLLKRELLLRLRAEHDDAPGRSRPATEYFRRQVRRLMIRHPLFALEYHRLALDYRLGRPDTDRPRRRPSRRAFLAAARASVMATPRRRRVRGVLLAVLLAIAAATAAVVAMDGVGSHGRTAPRMRATPRSPHLAPESRWHPPRHITTARTETGDERRAASKPRSSRSSRAPRTVLVSNRVSAAVISTAEASRPVEAHGAGPAPLPSPPGGSSPSPLKAP